MKAPSTVQPPMIAASALLPYASGAALSARLGVTRIVASGLIGAGEGAIIGFGDSGGGFTERTV